MGRDLHINLAYLPWPVSVLKFHKVVYEMQPGDNLIAKISDADVVGNIQQLFSSQADFFFDISQTDTDYRILVTRRCIGGIV